VNQALEEPPAMSVNLAETDLKVKMALQVPPVFKGNEVPQDQKVVWVPLALTDQMVSMGNEVKTVFPAEMV